MLRPTLLRPCGGVSFTLGKRRWGSLKVVTLRNEVCGSSLGNWESQVERWEKTGKSDGETSGIPVVGESNPEDEK